MPKSKIALSKYGGIKALHGKKTGYFHTEMISGKYWFVDPDGCTFFAVGTCRTHFPEEGRRDRIGWFKPTKQAPNLTKEIWSRHTAERLASWGFNWGAPWGETEQLPGIRTGWVDASYGFGMKKGTLKAPGIPHYMTFVDIFDPDWAKHFEERCEKAAKQQKNDPWLAGYFTDNELFWGWGMYAPHSLFDAILYQPSTTYAKKEFARFFKDRYKNDLTELNKNWQTNLSSWDSLMDLTELPQFNLYILEDKRAFLYHWAHTYFKTTGTILKKADPNHLNLGCRIHGNCEKEVVMAMGEFVDVISYNKYDNCAPLYQLEEMFYRWAKKPIMVSEWGFRAEDAGLPNTGGVGRLTKTQDERGKKYEEFQDGIVRSPYCIGSVWYSYVDDPREGTKDNLLPQKTENSNYGLVSDLDEPYKDMIRHVVKSNKSVYKTRLADKKPDDDCITIICPKDFFREPFDRFFIQRNGRVKGQEYLRAFLKGEDMGIDSQPITFDMEFDTTVTFSAWGYQVEQNAILEFMIDGKEKTVFDLPAGPGKGIIAKQMPKGWQSVYDKEFSITIPAGRHSVQVRNAGKGWIWLNAYKVYLK
jgi:hypothetical protein